MLAACKRALETARADSDFVRLDKATFEKCRSDSIDYAVMEHTASAAVVPVAGNVIAEDTHNCYLRSEGGLVAAIGVEDLVVVATDDAVMVAASTIF
jgi:mannose-1-phosphate guanylyltransferase